MSTNTLFNSSAILLILILPCVLSSFDKNSLLISDLTGAIDAEFVPDIAQIVVLSESSLRVVNSNTGKLTDIKLAAGKGEKFVSMAVGKNAESTMVAVNSQNGKITIFDLVGKEVVLSDAKMTVPATSMCFSEIGNPSMLVTTYNDQVRVFNADTDISQVILTDEDSLVRAACNPSNGYIFAVSWVRNSSFVSLFDISVDFDKLTILKTITLNELEDDVTDLLFNPRDTTQIMFVGNFPNIWVLSTITDNYTTFMEVSGPNHKLKVSISLQNIVVSNNTIATCFTKEIEGLSEQSIADGLQIQQVKTYHIVKGVVTLNPLGGQLFYINSKGGVIREQCPNGYFYVNGECVACLIADCSRCAQGDTCGKCGNQHFLVNSTSCGGICGEDCQECEKAETCLKCFKGFMVKKNGQCGQGLPFYAFMLILGSAALVILVILVIVGIKVKKSSNETKRLLEEEP